MFQNKIIFVFVIAVALVELSRQQQTTENDNDLKRNEKNDAMIKMRTLGAVRRGDIRGFRSGMNIGGMKSYDNMFQNYSYPKIKEIKRVMYKKMHIVEILVAFKLAVPASKSQPSQNLFNVTILHGTEAISQLSLNVEALKKWEYYEKPLHTLCSLPEVEPRIVKLLLDKGLDINERSNLRPLRTPVEFAAFQGNLALVKFLIEQGADPKRMFQNDLKEFHDKNYYRFIEVFPRNELVVRNRSTVHHNALFWAISGGNKDVIKYLISLGVDVNVRNQSWAALFNTVADDKAEIVEILLKNGCDVNGRDPLGATALHMAADTGNLEIAKLLLKNGANATAIDKFGWTPLHVAAFSSHNITLVELLLKAGASIEVTTDGGFTPLILTEAGFEPSFLGCLRQAITNNFSKYVSCKQKSKTYTHQDNIYITTLLCNRGADVKHVDDAIGWSVLHWAGAIGDENGARLLVEKCKASAMAHSKAGMTPGDVAKYFAQTLLN